MAKNTFLDLRAGNNGERQLSGVKLHRADKQRKKKLDTGMGRERERGRERGDELKESCREERERGERERERERERE